jgi:hypothetical protein
LLAAPAIAGWGIVSHPDVAWQAGELKHAELLRVDLFGSLPQLLKTVDLQLAEVRTIEALTPGPLVLARKRSDEERQLLLAIPDSSDLRQVAEGLDRPIAAYVSVTGASEEEAVALLTDATSDPDRRRLIGVLTPATRIASASPTIVQVTAPGDVQAVAVGSIPVASILQATTTPSQWEIDDWT